MQALWMVLGTLFFSMMGVCIKLAAPYYGAMEIMFCRGLVSMALFSLLLMRQRIPFSTPVLNLHIKRNLAGVAAMALWFYAITVLPFATAMMLNNMSSIWLGVILIGLTWRHTGRIFYPKLLIAVLLGFGGVVLLLNPQHTGGSLLPGLLGLLSGFVAAIAYFHLQAMGQTGEPELRIVFYFSVGTTLMGLFGTLFLQGGFTVPVWRTYWLLPVAGVFASLGQWCLTRAYTRGSPLVVACLQYMGLVFSSLFGVFLFHEKLPWSAWLGMIIIVISGIAATVLRPQRPTPSVQNPCRTTP